MFEKYISQNSTEVLFKIPKETITFAVLNSPYAESIYFDDEGNYDINRLKVIDQDLFIKDILNTLSKEREDGSSLMSDLFDQAFENLMEYDFSDGIEINEE